MRLFKILYSFRELGFIIFSMNGNKEIYLKDFINCIFGFVFIFFILFWLYGCFGCIFLGGMGFFKMILLE